MTARRDARQPPHARGHALLAPERLRVAKAGLDCKACHGALADRVKWRDF